MLSGSVQEELRYAVRLCNHGGRTANGDCGLPSVKGPDDTTFRFASCSLSFNGTTLARGQIPCLIYYRCTFCTAPYYVYYDSQELKTINASLSQRVAREQ